MGTFRGYVATMTSKKERESLENREKCYRVVQQSSAKGGVRAIEIAEKTGLDRTTVHRHLGSLGLTGKVESKQGFYIVKLEEQPTQNKMAKQTVEKEIIIELPMPKNKWYDIARLQVHANYLDNMGLRGVAKMEKTIIEKFNETRTIRITGKNVDDIDLEKIGNLIQQATQKSSRFNLNNILRKIQKTPKLDTKKLEQSEDNKK